MKIGIVTTWFERGAAYVSRQYKNLLEKHHEIYIYARGGESYAIGDSLWDGDFVTWGKKSIAPVPMAIDLDDFKRWIIDNRIETVFFNEQQWFEPVILCNHLGVITGSYIDYYTEETIPFFACHDFLICNTLRHYSAFEWHPQVFYVPWGTDVELFHPIIEPESKCSSIAFFHSCGLSPHRKGTDILIKAFSELKGPSRLILHSQINLKEYYPEIQSLIESLEQSNRLVCYHKTVPAPGLYHLGDVYVYPSRLDGIGLTIAEALSCGLPVITSDYPPMNEFINETNGKLIKISRLYARSDGYYWPQCLVEQEDLRECMQYYVNNRNEIMYFRQMARKYAETKLDWSKNEIGLSEIFKSAKKVPNEIKHDSENKIRIYEQNKSIEMQLYNKSPLLFKIFRQFWLSVINKK
jgi:glycosyltransferase involved in cell wall biosynthesis